MFDPDHMPTNAAGDSATGAAPLGSVAAACDWAATPLGPVEHWPAALRTAAELVMASPMPSILLWGSQLTVAAVNDPYRPLLGGKPDALGRPMLDVWAEAAATIGPQLARVMAGETLRFEDVRFSLSRGNDGKLEDAWFDYGFSPVRDEQGRVMGVLNVAMETTARRRAEEAAATEAERVRLALAAGAIIGTWFWDLTTDSFTVDEAFAKSFGIDPAYGRAGLSLAQVIETVHPDDEPGLEAGIDEAIGRGGRYAHRYRVRRADGHYYWIEANGRVDRDATGRSVSFPGVLLDIEDRKRADDALRQRTAELESLVTSAPIGVAFFDRDHRYLRVNEELAELNGIPAAEHIGRRIEELLPVNAVAVAPHVDHVFSTGETVRGVEVTGETLKAPGVMRTWLTNYYPVRDERGAVSAVGAWAVEISERKRVEALARRNEERLRLALEAAGGVGIWEWDVQADRLSADERFAFMFGLDAAAAAAGLPARAYLDAIHPDDLPAVEAALGEAMASGWDYRIEYRVRGSDNVWRWGYSRGRCELDAEGKPSSFPGVVVDVSDRKEAEAALAEGEAKFNAIANSIDQMVWSTRPDGFHDYFNNRWYEFTGVPRGSTDGEAWRGLFHPDDQERLSATWTQSLETGEPYQIEYRLRHASGEYRWVVGRALCTRDANGRITRWFGTCTDIHDLKQTQAALQEALEEKEALLYEVNHRVKNNLQVVTGLLTMQARQSRSPEVRRDLEDARARIGIIAGIHQALYSTGAHDQVEMTSFLRRMSEATAASLGRSGVSLRFRADHQAVLPLKQAMSLALVVSELLTNAVKYAFPSDRAGVIEVSVIRASDDLVVEVADDGVGLPEGFDPAGSTGVGMKVIGVLTRQLRSRLEVVLREQGSAFRISVPSAFN